MFTKKMKAFIIICSTIAIILLSMLTVVKIKIYKAEIKHELLEEALEEYETAKSEATTKMVECVFEYIKEDKNSNIWMLKFSKEENDEKLELHQNYSKAITAKKYECTVTDEQIYATHAAADAEEARMSAEGHINYFIDSISNSNFKFEFDYYADGSINYYGYTEEEYLYMVEVITGEAQCCSILHQLYVGSVVFNRLGDDEFPNSIAEVCLQKTPNIQYECFWNNLAFRAPTEITKAVAYELLKIGSILPSEVVYQAEFLQGSGLYEQVGNTYFCYK